MFILPFWRAELVHSVSKRFMLVYDQHLSLAQEKQQECLAMLVLKVGLSSLGEGKLV